MAALQLPSFIRVPMERYLERDTSWARRLRIVRESLLLSGSEPGIRQVAVTFAVTLGILLTGLLFSAMTLRTQPGAGGTAKLTAWIWLPIGVYVATTALLTVLSQAMVILRVNSVMLGSPAPQRFLLRHAWRKTPGLVAFATVTLLAKFARALLRPLNPLPAIRRLRGEGALGRWHQTTYVGFAVKTLEHLSARASVRRGIAIAELRWGREAREVPTLTAPLLVAGLPPLVAGAVFALLGFRSLGLLTALAGVSITGFLLSVSLGCYAVAVYVFALGGPPAFGFREADLAGAFEVNGSTP